MIADFVARAPKTGVLLVNTGSPERPDAAAVRSYLARYLSDPRIVPTNPLLWKLILHCCILTTRPKQSAEKYRLIWTNEGSPLIVGHEKLAAALADDLAQEGFACEVRSAMSYSHPLVKTALESMREAGCNRLVVVPTYPQSAFSTTMAVHDDLEKQLRLIEWAPDLQFVESYSSNPAYSEAIAASIEDAGFEAERGDRVLLSFHSIPIKDVEAGDTYGEQARVTGTDVARLLGIEPGRCAVSFHSRFDKQRSWVSPFTHDVLETWACEPDAQRVFVACPGFAVDCLESLYDINMQLKPYYEACRREAGGTIDGDSFVYVPCLGYSQRHVAVLRAVVMPFLTKGDS